MLIRLVFSNIVHPWYFPVILTADVQRNLMEHHGQVKKLLKQIWRGYSIYAAYLKTEYLDSWV